MCAGTGTPGRGGCSHLRSRTVCDGVDHCAWDGDGRRCRREAATDTVTTEVRLPGGWYYVGDPLRYLDRGSRAELGRFDGTFRGYTAKGKRLRGVSFALGGGRPRRALHGSDGAAYRLTSGHLGAVPHALFTAANTRLAGRVSFFGGGPKGYERLRSGLLNGLRSHCTGIGATGHCSGAGRLVKDPFRIVVHRAARDGRLLQVQFGDAVNFDLW